MAARRRPPTDEWELGPEPPEYHEFAASAEAEPIADFSAARLTRRVQVVTVEHLAWSGIAIWALLTRVLELDFVPLAPNEARHALFEYDLINGTNLASAAGYHPASAGWIHLIEAGLFALGGVNDLAARLVFVAAGLLMITTAFFMRPYIGRAGAIALAGLIAVSPTFTHFSRTSAIEIVAVAIAMTVIEAFMVLIRRPTAVRAIGFGCASGLLCASGRTGFVAAGALLAALLLLGLYQVVAMERPFLNLRIWLVRYASALVAAIGGAALAWFASEISLFRFAAVAENIERVCNGFATRNYLAGFQHYAPGLLLYEFLITVAAINGLIVIISWRTWSPLALFSLLWLVISFACFLGNSQPAQEQIVFMLLPLVIVGALGIDYLHHAPVWPYVRVALAVLVAITLYVQVMANFVYAAPSANELPWSHHANLYWREGATTVEARGLLREVRQRFPETGGTAFSREIWPPSLRWYLRDFRPTNSGKMADLVINPVPPSGTVRDADFEQTFSIDLEQSWQPALNTLTVGSAIRFLLSADAWTPLRNSTIAVMVHPRLELGPTLIMPPPLNP
jgi:predicted membrane-bound mannosyltransferase